MLKIEDIVTSLGSIEEGNHDIESLVGWDAKEILDKTGIEKRFIASVDESAESLALHAIKKIDLGGPKPLRQKTFGARKRACVSL